MLRKHGTGEILPEEGDAAQQKTAAKDWTPSDDAALAKENADTDEEK